MAEANNPMTGQDDGHIGLPTIGLGMNKLPPTPGNKDGKDFDNPLGQEKRKVQKDDADLLERARKRFDRCAEVESENRKNALDDMNMIAGKQWPADIEAQRNQDQRPCLTINKLPTFIHQITNDQRQNRPSIDVLPVGERGDKEAAKMYRGMIRAIERLSSADIAYDTAFEHAVGAGFGYFRLNLKWEDGFDQSITIDRIRNPFTVYMDPDCQQPECSDARYAFVTELIPRDEFEELYPDAMMVPFNQQGLGDKFKNWSTKDGVRVAEYFEVTSKARKLVQLSNGHEGWEDEMHDMAHAQLKRGSIEVLRSRDVQVKTCKWYKLTALEVIEERTWPGEAIPICRVVGNEIDIEGKVRLSGIVRDAKDSQRMYNYWVTMETEMVSLAPKAPFIVEEGQIEGHEQLWQNANVKSYPYLPYRGTSVNGTPAPPPQRQPPVGVPAGIVNARQSAALDMVATTGVRFDAASEHDRVDDRSGRALHELHRATDLGSFHYIDNLIRALKHCGSMLVDLIPKIYSDKRMALILREDGSEELIQIDPHANQAYGEQPNKDPKKPPTKVLNPNVGRYGVTIETGPSYATKRIEAAEQMMAFAQAMPNTAHLIADLIAKEQDWPGAEEMASRLAKALPPNLTMPEKKDIPPQLQAAVANLQSELDKHKQMVGQLSKALEEKDKDREIAREKIDKDFEAKLLAVMQKAEAEMSRSVIETIKMQLGAMQADRAADMAEKQQKETKDA